MCFVFSTSMLMLITQQYEMRWNYGRVNLWWEGRVLIITPSIVEFNDIIILLIVVNAELNENKI